MSKTTTKIALSDYTKLIEKMKRERNGKLTKSHHFFAKSDPEFLAVYDDLFALVMTKDRNISVKCKELIAIGILAAKGEYDALKLHLSRALEAGVTRAEIIEALEVTMMYSGAESMIYGSLELINVLKRK
jgi:alkylhydroperoxidase/carboxymuconolactone decarboxylase family protein YurZ